jgi:hypothetical protein
MANAVSSDIADAQDNRQPPPEPSVTNLNYTQNNNSPKALSPKEIYRGTKSQLAVVKGALDNK